MPKVISDSSTLIHLAAIGRLELLRVFFGDITIPPAVWHEVVEEGKGRSGALEVKNAFESGWIEIITPENEDVLRLLKLELNEGEAQTIALALQLDASLVLLDETDARRVAEVSQLQKTGVVGILIRAKLEGKITDLRIELDQLRTAGGFWINDELYHHALKSAGE